MLLRMLVLLACLMTSIPGYAARISLPSPEGQHSVGYWAGALQTAQDDAISSRAGDKRRLGISVWYPADGSGPGNPKPWATVALGDAIAATQPVPKGFQNNIFGHARLGLRPIGGRLPAIIFSHGLSFPPALYQSLFEDLASRGYVVVAVSHPHGAPLIEYPDGGSLGMAEWPGIESEDQREAFLARHVEVWADDLRAVLDWVSAGIPNSPLAGKLDTSRIAVAGHSYGGTAAARLTLDPRVKAAIIMEGLVRDPADSKWRGNLTIGAPLLHLIGGYNRLEHEGRQYRPGDSAPVYQAVINGTGHAYFSDLIYIYREFADAGWRERHRYETDPGRVLQIARDYMAAFLDHYLSGAEASVLLRPKSYADRVESPRHAGYPEVDLTIDIK